jgi:transglutaminase-like putative cysteine protease
MNGVPARVVSGNIVGGGPAHHLRTLVWLECVGWIPVEPTAVTSNKREVPMRKFGNWGGTMLNSNVNIGYSVPVNGNQRYIGALDTLWLLPVSGKDESTWEFACTRI